MRRVEQRRRPVVVTVMPCRTFGDPAIGHPIGDEGPICAFLKALINPTDAATALATTNA